MGRLWQMPRGKIRAAAGHSRNKDLISLRLLQAKNNVLHLTNLPKARGMKPDDGLVRGGLRRVAKAFCKARTLPPMPNARAKSDKPRQPMREKEPDFK